MEYPNELSRWIFEHDKNIRAWARKYHIESNTEKLNSMWDAWDELSRLSIQRFAYPYIG